VLGYCSIMSALWFCTGEDVSSNLPMNILILFFLSKKFDFQNFQFFNLGSKFNFNKIQAQKFLKLVKISPKTARGVENFYDG
jgi:hypothetical protein